MIINFLEAKQSQIVNRAINELGLGISEFMWLVGHSSASAGHAIDDPDAIQNRNELCALASEAIARRDGRRLSVLPDRQN